MTEKEFNKKWENSDISLMTEEQKKEYVNDLFDRYENEGFSKVFWSQSYDYTGYFGKEFRVLGRTPIWDGKNDGADLDCLPMWKIQFENGTGIDAYPEEIIVSEMKKCGCPDEYLPAKMRHKQTCPDTEKRKEKADGQKIYTHDVATSILEKFDDMLCANGIKIPSPDDDQREEDNESALFGETYSDLLDEVEDILVRMLDAAGVKDYVQAVYSGNY